MTRRIVCDTGPLLHLAEADLLATLFAAGRIHCPPAVRTELERLQDVPPNAEHRPDVVELTEASRQEAEGWVAARILDRGEAEALVLARQLDAHWFLTDDSAARWMAQRSAIEVHGSLGVLLWAAATQRLGQTEAEDGLDRLARSSLWISSRVLTEAREALREIFGRR